MIMFFFFDCLPPPVLENPHPPQPPVEVLVLPGDPELPEVDFCGYNVEGDKVCCGINKNT